MSTPRYVADLHLGHRNIYKYRPVFESTLHNDLFFLEVLRKVSTKRDTMYFLGDIIFDKNHLHAIRELPGTKILIPGNHCTEYVSMRELVSVFDDIHASLKKHGTWLTHIPIHDAELRGKPNVHGHVHAHSVPSVNHLNVSVDSMFMKYFPRTLDEVRKALDWQQRTGEYYKGIDTDEAKTIITTNPETSDIFYSTLAESKKTKVIL